jgi:hypothetical protein
VNLMSKTCIVRWQRSFERLESKHEKRVDTDRESKSICCASFAQLGRCLVAAAVRSLRRKEEERDVPGMLAVSRSFQFNAQLGP